MNINNDISLLKQLNTIDLENNLITYRKGDIHIVSRENWTKGKEAEKNEFKKAVHQLCLKTLRLLSKMNDTETVRLVLNVQELLVERANTFDDQKATMRSLKRVRKIAVNAKVIAATNKVDQLVKSHRRSQSETPISEIKEFYEQLDLTDSELDRLIEGLGKMGHNRFAMGLIYFAKGRNLKQNPYNFLSKGKVREEGFEQAVDERMGELLQSWLLESEDHLVEFFDWAIGCSDTYREMVQTIGKSIGKEDLFKEGLNSSIHTPTTSVLFLRFDPNMKEHLNRLLDNGLPITVNLLNQSFFSLNIPLISIMLDRLTEDFMLENRDEIMNHLKETDHQQLWELTEKRFPDLIQQCSFDLLRKATREGRGYFVDWVLSHGRELSDKERLKLLTTSVRCGYLPLVQSLCEQSETLQYPQVLKFNPKNKKRLFKFAHFSPMKDVIQLVGYYPKAASHLREIMNMIPLTTRFPNARFFQELGGIENMKEKPSISTYIKNSIDFAEKSLNVAENESVQQTFLSGRDSFIHRVAEKRCEVFQSSPKFLTRFQKDDPEPLARTPWLPMKRMNRYSWSLRHLIPLMIDQNSSEWTIPDYLSVSMKTEIEDGEEIGTLEAKEKQGIQYSYTYEEEGQKKSLPTTFLNSSFSFAWHTHPDTIIELQSHLEDLHQEIVNFDLNPLDPKSMSDFQEKVARGYWLIGTLCETLRGTPFNARVWLYLVHQHHNLPSPIPKLDHFFLDTTMVVTPLEKAIEDWDSYFEPTLDEAIKQDSNIDFEQTLQSLLSADGLLLKECSLDIRSDEKWTKIAISQNPDAAQFAIR